jgi:hypothetical protein
MSGSNQALPFLEPSFELLVATLRMQAEMNMDCCRCPASQIAPRQPANGPPFIVCDAGGPDKGNLTTEESRGLENSSRSAVPVRHERERGRRRRQSGGSTNPHPREANSAANGAARISCAWSSWAAVQRWVPTIGCSCDVCVSGPARQPAAAFIVFGKAYGARRYDMDFRQQRAAARHPKLDDTLPHAHADHILRLDDVRPFFRQRPVRFTPPRTRWTPS